MIWIVAVLLAIACVQNSIAGFTNIVCYYPSWSISRTGNGQYNVSNIDPNLCTHIIYAFAGIDENGTFTLLDEEVDITLNSLVDVVALKEVNTNLKVLIGIGGWSEGSIKYSAMAADDSLRANFINTTLAFIQEYGFDGVDIDWEYPAQRGGNESDKENFVTLLKELREVCDENSLILTAAVAASGESVSISYDIANVSEYLHLINIMDYDLHGTWDGVTGANAPLYASSIDTTESQLALNVNYSIHQWIDGGADPQKIVMGVPFYAKTFNLTDASNNTLGAPINGGGTPGPYTQESGTVGYNEICEWQLEGNWTIVWDDEQKVPYTYKDTDWVSYDNAESIALKVEYAKSMNLSGIMIWALGLDDFNGICGEANILLNTINDSMGN